MHALLLIDEILQEILDACSLWSEKEYRSTLSQLARCCRAWEDPALDRLWSRLDSISPLVHLLPGCAMREGVIELTSADEVKHDAFVRFHAYASRVKSIKHTGSIRMPPALRSFIFLPKLTSVRFAYAGCDVSPCWSISRAVREVDVNVGFATDPHSADADQAVRTRSSAVAEYLDELLATAADVQTLRVRGSVTEQVDRRVARFTSLRVLDLHMGPCLSVHTLSAIATDLPLLRKLDVNAQHIDAKEFRRALPSPTAAARPFPSLQHLTIRAQPDLLVVLLPLMPIDVLQSFHLDADCSNIGPSSLHPVFECLSTRVPSSLQKLTIEHYPDLEDIKEVEPSTGYSDWFTIQLLRPLARLSNVRQFGVAATKPPHLGDCDVAEISSWWPNLEHLDLGALDDAEDCGRGMTPAAYASLAECCPVLRSLTLPVEVPDLSKDPHTALVRVPGCTYGRPACSLSQPALRCLRIGRLPDDAGSASAFLNFIRRLFPSLDTIEDVTSLDRAAARPDDAESVSSSYYTDILYRCRCHPRSRKA